jgi:hypothetical protein
MARDSGAVRKVAPVVDVAAGVPKDAPRSRSGHARWSWAKTTPAVVATLTFPATRARYLKVRIVTSTHHTPAKLQELVVRSR